MTPISSDVAWTQQGVSGLEVIRSWVATDKTLILGQVDVLTARQDRLMKQDAAIEIPKL